MSDHYFKMDTMLQMGESIKNGKPPHLNEATRKNLLQNLAEMRKTPVGRLLGSSSVDSKEKKKWWQFGS
jgi:hypothetical protein